MILKIKLSTDLCCHPAGPKMQLKCCALVQFSKNKHKCKTVFSSDGQKITRCLGTGGSAAVLPSTRVSVSARPGTGFCFARQFCRDKDPGAECFSAADQTAADVWPAPACVHCSTAAPARYLHTAWLARLEILAIKSELHNVISQICG